MDINRISEDVQSAEGVRINNRDGKTLYVREDEVIRLILKYAYNIDYVKTEASIDNYEKL
jgi:hypothetical protein